MPVTERYQVDFFAVVVLIAATLIVVFLIIAAIYYWNLINLKPPTSGEATFLFWTAVVLIIIFIIIGIYALVHIFTHKAIIYEEPKQIVAPAVVPVLTPQVPIQMVSTQQIPTAPIVSPVPIQLTSAPSDLSQSLSDVPVTQMQRQALNQELIYNTGF